MTSTTFRVTNNDLVYDFFRANLRMSRTNDFRGCLFVPITYYKDKGMMEHVAIAVGYNNFNGRLCSMHAVIQDKSYVSPGIVREVFEYPFLDCKVNHILAPVEADNEEALDFDRRLGFKELYRFKEGAQSGFDLVMLGMSKEDCRWLGKRKHHG